MDKINQRIATELGVGIGQVSAAVDLLDDGATVPFIARYRKESDRRPRRHAAARAGRAPGLPARAGRAPRRGAEEHRGAGQADAGAARRDRRRATTKHELEDLYLPYKPKRRTKAQIAREAGLEPLADALFADPSLDPAGGGRRRSSTPSKGVADAKAALDGVRDILIERWAEDAALVGALREWLWERGRAARPSVAARTRTSRRRQVPRLLRLRTSRSAACRRTARWRCSAAATRACSTLELDARRTRTASRIRPRARIAVAFGWRDRGRAGRRPGSRETVRLAWKVKLAPVAWSATCSRACARRPRREAINVFAENLRDLLLAAPAGPRVVDGPRPGHPHRREGRGGRRHRQGARDRHRLSARAAQRLGRLARARWPRCARRTASNLIAIGNGTASRETDKLAAELISARCPELEADARWWCSEAGASVYSASEFARKEFPDLDVTPARRGVASRGGCRTRWPSW